MKIPDKTSPPRLVALLAGAALLGLATQNTLAAGTAAATSISNAATLAYTVSGVPQTNIVGTSAAFLVDEKINLTVAGGATTNVVPSATSQVLTFTVTNNSNSALDFNLASNQVAAGDNFDATACSQFVESGATGGYQLGEDTATFIDELAIDASKTVYVVCNIPAGVVNGNTALVGLTATARGDFTGADNRYAATVGTVGGAITQTAGANTANVDIVFADIAGSEAGDASRDAKHSDRDTYSVVTSALSVTKTAILKCDPINGTTDPKNIPGSITQWTITVSNGAGGSDAILTTITDTVSATLAHDTNLITMAGACNSATGTPESAAGKGFKVTSNAPGRKMGGSAGGATAMESFFTTANDADGVELNGAVITATFANILPADAPDHTSAGLLKANETVTIIFNTTVQ